MVMIACLAHTDICAQVSRHQDEFLVTLKTDRTSEICLTFNYLQIKVLAEGLLALAAQTKLGELATQKTKEHVGDMSITFILDDRDESINEKENRRHAS